MLERINHPARAIADVTHAYKAFEPPLRLTVAEGTAKNLYLKQPGGVPGLWDASETPYIVEPMNTISSRMHEATAFIGPARTGKTAGLLLGGMCHGALVDPGDMLFIQMTQDKAREFSKTDVERALRDSPNMHAMLGRSQDRNTHDVMFRNGVWMRIAWPTVSNVSGSTYRYAFITDLDRILNAENVDGEGPLFKLALKRTTTFGSRGMCVVESSPGIEVVDPNWRPATPHEGPPVTGIMGIYNQGDRRRRYWKCFDCKKWFLAGADLALFQLPSDDVLLEIIREANLEALATEYNRIICPCCGAKHGPGAKMRFEAAGRWLKDGQMLTPRDELVGEAHESTIASFWLGGVSARYQPWRSLILRHLQGLRDYALNGSEETLKATVNTDQGSPYISMRLREAQRAGKDPKERKEKDLLRFVVPKAARFLIATVDNQGGTNARFEVQVHAIGPAREKWLINRFRITESERPGVVEGTKAPIDPARYVEDWDTITKQVIRSTYKTEEEGREMRVLLTVVDTGGEAGATDRSYEWFRRVRQQGLANRVMLIKGVGKDQKATFPFIKETLVGARNPKEKGDIPLYLLNTNKLKDIIDAGLKRQVPGPGYVHLPDWINQAFIDELQSEVRQDNGVWMQVRKRNEAFDLLVYCEAGLLRLRADQLKWEQYDLLPKWARLQHENSEVITREERIDMKEDDMPAQIQLPDPVPAQPRPKPAQRRRSHSSYLSS